MLRTCFVLAFACILGSASSSQAQSNSLNENQLAGRKIFQTRCSMCHVGQDPATELADGTTGRQWTFGPLLSKKNAANESGLRRKITNGGPRMPAYKLALTGEQIDQVIAFMKTIDEPLTKLAATRPGE